MKLITIFTFATLAGLAAVTTQNAAAEGIGINFTGNAWLLQSTDQPGIVSGGNWNNVNGSSGTNFALHNAAAASTTALLSFASTGADPGLDVPSTANAATNLLYRGGLWGDNTIREVSIQLSNIPFRSYDVYVYASPVAGPTNTLSITDGVTTFYYRGTGQNNSSATSLLQTTSTDSFNPTSGAAQYQVFRGLTNSSFGLTTGGSITSVIANHVMGLQIQAAPILPTHTAPTPQYGYLTGTIDPNKPTVVITHGWQPTGSSNTPVQWTTDMANTISAANPNVNIVTWTWPEAFVNIQHLGDAAKDAVNEGLALGLQLKALGAHDIHFVGHSLGTYVNAYATEFLTSHNVSVAQATLLDRPQVLANEESFFNSTLKNVSWVDNYYGDDTGGLTPATGGPLNIAAYNKQVSGNHVGVHDWYAGTISNTSTDGYHFSNEGGGANQRGIQPLPQQHFVSTPATLFDAQQWDITPNSLIAGSTARLIEHSPAYLWSTTTIPIDATYLSFDLLWNNKGDGDYLSVYFGDTLLLSLLGSTFDTNELTGSGLIPISDIAGLTDQFLFALNSTGSPNADVTVSNVSFTHQVPEPSTCLLVVVGVLFLCRFAIPRRRLTMRCSERLRVSR